MQGSRRVQQICPSRIFTFILYILILDKSVFFSSVLQVSGPSGELVMLPSLRVYKSAVKDFSSTRKGYPAIERTHSAGTLVIQALC